MERLQRFLAHAGLASRRRCEEMITAGRVRVNGRIVAVLGTQVDPEHDVIEVDGRPVSAAVQHVYLLLNKPAGYLSTASDARGRPTVLDLVASAARLYPVGRLDLDSEGLLLLTDDGDLAQRLLHPSFEHQKEYHVCVEGRPTARTLQRLREGIELEDGFTWPAEVDELRQAEGCTWLRFAIHEGRKRQLRRMCAAVGHPVRRLVRVRMGPLSLKDLASGEHRALTPGELMMLKHAAGLE